MIIDCLRNRYLGTLSLCAECAPEPLDCGFCTPVPCRQELAEKKQALRELSNGSAVQEVSEGDRRIRYFHSIESFKCLKESIAELEMKCGASASLTMDTCGGLETTFERVRPPPIQIGYRNKW